MRGQDHREPGRGIREVAVDKSPSYFFFSVIYGNVCRQSGAMNGIWWSQGYRRNVEPPVMNVDLLTQEQVVKWGADRRLLLFIHFLLGPAGLLCLFKAVPRRSLPPSQNMKPFIKQSVWHRRWLVVASNISFHLLRSWYSVTLRQWTQTTNGFHSYNSICTSRYISYDRCNWIFYLGY